MSTAQAMEAAPEQAVRTISVFVNNKPGVLVRVALVFSRRGFNIESLVVSPAAEGRFSRMTVTCSGVSTDLEQVVKQLAKLVGEKPKRHETRTDWRRRPLSKRQVEYALDDVRHLPSLRDAICAELTRLGRLEWLAEGRDAGQPFMLMLQHKAPHRSWMPGPDHLTTFENVTIPEPETLFDDYAGRASPARTQDMTIKKTMNANDLKLRAPGNLTPEQRKLWDAAYGPKNEAFEKANLEGDELVRWKYQRYIKDYLRSIASVDDGVGQVLDYLEESGLAKNTIVIATINTV